MQRAGVTFDSYNDTEVAAKYIAHRLSQGLSMEAALHGALGALGADCVEKEMTVEHTEALAALLDKAGMVCGAEDFRRFGSARKLYNFDIDNA